MHGDIKPPCNTTCGKPKKELTGTNLEAWRLWQLLSVHARPFDGMGGNILPLYIRDVRAEAVRTSDPDNVTQKILLIDHIAVEKWRKDKQK